MSAPAVAEVETQSRCWVFASRRAAWPALATVAAMVLLWTNFLATMVFDWKTDPQYAHGWLIPVLALVLLGSRWGALPAARPPTVRIVPLIVIATSLLGITGLAFLQAVSPENRLFQWAHGLCVGAVTFAIIFLHGGAAWMRQLAFPVCFLLLAVPWPRDLQNQITGRLMYGVAATTVELTLLTGTPAVQKGNTIGLTDGSVGIDEACSGVRSLHGSLIVSLFLGAYFGLRASQRVALLLFAVVGSLALNVVRATTLTMISASHGHRALETFHDPAGLAILAVVFTACVAAASAFAKRQTTDSAPTGATAARAKRPSSIAGKRSPHERTVALHSIVILSEAEAGEGGQPSEARRIVGDRRDQSVVEGSPISGRSEAVPRRGNAPAHRKLLISTAVAISCWLILTIAACYAYYGPQPRVEAVDWRLDFSRLGTVHDAPLSPTARQFLRYHTAQAKSVQLANGSEVQVIDLHWQGGEISAAGARLHHAAACLPSIGYELKERLPEEKLQVHGIAMNFDANGFNAAGRQAYVYQARWENGAPGRAEDFDQSFSSARRAVKERRRLERARVLLLMFIGPADSERAGSELKAFLDEVVVPIPATAR